MQVEFWTIGKSEKGFIEDGIKTFVQKIKYFQKVNVLEIKAGPDGKQEAEVYKKIEKEAILSRLNKEDYLVVLDEKGQLFSSVKFAAWLENYAVHYSSKRLIFLVGGAYGFHEDIYNRAQFKISLSPMTFSHQLIRIIFLEQLFRAYTIINNHPYHNE